MKQRESISNGIIEILFTGLAIIIVGPIVFKWIPYFGDILAPISVLFGLYIIVTGVINKIEVHKQEVNNGPDNGQENKEEPTSTG